MNATCKGLDTRSWRDLYQAAIFEPDLSKLPERIADAEAAIVVSVRDLFYKSGDKIDKTESLDAAMCILHALRSSLKRRSSAIPSADSVPAILESTSIRTSAPPPDSLSSFEARPALQIKHLDTKEDAL